MTVERGVLPPAQRALKLLALIAVFCAWWLVTSFVYHRTQSNFLRAESGWYLFLSHSPSAKQHEAERNLLTKSYKGHYTPLAFMAEFTTAKLVGTHAGFWKRRQIVVLALLATMCFLLVRNSGYALQLSRLAANFCAASLTSIVIFQPQMREFVAWPYMVMQLFWLIFTLIALTSLIQIVRRPEGKLWPWLAAGTAYSSLHFLGLGMTTVAATAAVLGGICLWNRRTRPLDTKPIIVPLLSMIALTTFHGAIMVKFPYDPPPPPPPGAWQSISFLTSCLGFIPNFAFAIARGLFSTCQPIPGAEQISEDWPYGVAILLGLGFLVSSSFWCSLKETTARNEARFVLRTFASVSFLTIIALTAVRVWREPSPHGFADYLGGSRYLIPGAFTLIGLMVELFFLIASAPLFLNAVLNIGIVVCAVTGNLNYAANVYPKIAPNSMISHARAWTSVVTMARECQQANLAIPNVPLGALIQEFPWDLKLFEPLLRADLKLPPESRLQFTDWAIVTNELRSEYDRAAPSLTEVRWRLQLNAARQHTR